MSKDDLRPLLERMTNNLAVSMLLLDTLRTRPETPPANMLNTVFTLQQEVLRTLQTLEMRLL